jgi:hypothetical protein
MTRSVDVMEMGVPVLQLNGNPNSCLTNETGAPSGEH